MTMKRLTSTLGLMTAALIALGASGCVVVADGNLRDYEPCAFNSDCDSFRCESVVGVWGDGVTTIDSICTVGCFDGLDCASTRNGFAGTCASVEGGADVCYETCQFDEDCPLGFACSTASICLPR